MKHPPVTNTDSHPILREEVEAAVKSLKPGKSAGVDNIPAELLQAGGETLIDVLLNICNKIWQTGEWPTPWTQSLVITFPKKGNLLQCQNYRTISLISHASKVMLKILLNRLTPQAETIIAEEQTGFRPGRSTTEQIFSLRILCERYLQHQQDLYHAFVDFKKAFNRVWHAALWSTMKLYNINANLIKVTESLYSKATSTVYYNGRVEWFRTTVESDRDVCFHLLFLTSSSRESWLKDQWALEAEQLLTYADDIDALAGKEDELVKLINHLDTTSTKYGMEISAEKTKLMTNNIKGISLDVRIGGQKLETVQSFKYLGSVVMDEGSKQEILSRIAPTIGALTKLKTIWKDKNIALSSKIRLMRSLVISIFLYACETLTLTAKLEKRIQTTEMRCFRRLLGISYKDHVTNEEVGNRIRQAIGPYEDLLTTVKKHKLRWYGHKTWSTGLAKMILQGTVQGGRRRGRQKKRWEDNITEWTGLKLGEALRKAENREEWRTVVARSSLVPQRSTRLRDKWSKSEVMTAKYLYCNCYILYPRQQNNSTDTAILHWNC